MLSTVGRWEFRWGGERPAATLYPQKTNLTVQE